MTHLWKSTKTWISTSCLEKSRKTRETFPHSHRLYSVFLFNQNLKKQNRTFHLLQKPDILTCYGQTLTVWCYFRDTHLGLGVAVESLTTSEPLTTMSVTCDVFWIKANAICMAWLPISTAGCAMLVRAG
jgi:hypothetical protein